MALDRLANGAYRFASRAIASVFGSFDFVEGVYLRRTAATGEVAFGRSDIDLTIILASPMAANGGPDRLMHLVRCCQMLRMLVPRLGECEVGTAAELIRSYRADPYRASLDRRTAVTLYGKPLEIPHLPVTAADALTWLVIWFAHYVPLAMQRGSRRNMRKFVLEMWSAARTATGDIKEPYPSRRIAESAWRALAGDAFPLSDADSVETLFQTGCRIVSEVHQCKYQPVEKIESPEIHDQDGRKWVLVPATMETPPPEVRRPTAFAGTPEALDLLIRHVNPRMYRHLPDSVKRLGVGEPGYKEWLDFCRRMACDPRLLRRPAFISSRKSSYYAFELIKPGRQGARQLREGHVPAWTGKPDEKLRAEPPSYGAYYRRLFPPLYEEILEAWSDLDECSA